MKKRKLSISAALILALLMILSGCKKGDGGNAGGDTGENTLSDGTGLNSEEITLPSEIDADAAFSKRDLKTDHELEDAVRISLSETDSITVSDEGTYLLSGTLNDGAITVDAEKTDKITLIFDGVHVNSRSEAALYVKCADKVFVTLSSGSENSLSSVGEFLSDGEGVDAAVFSKEDITFNGSGKLTVNSEYGHGIVSKDDVKFVGGEYEITASRHGISGKDRVYINGGSFKITADSDGIHSENKDDETLGEILILGGSFNISSNGDGIDGGAIIDIRGGEFETVTGGGAVNAEPKTEDFGFGGGFFGYEDTSDTEDTVSQKGIKADGNILISGGSFELDTVDDGIHSGVDSAVAGGEIRCRSGDDGIHADGNVSVSGGSVIISESYEGIEGMKIYISGGNIEISASDDGMNAAGGTSEGTFGFGDFGGFGGMAGGSNDCGITFSGGMTHIDADGDGIDSNGYITVTGGETYIDGPTNGANGALDYGTEAVISGGKFIAAGAAGMASNFSSASSQGAVMVNVNNTGKISLYDKNGNILIEYETEKPFSNIVISAPGITDSGKYTLTVGENVTDIEMNGIIYGGGGFGGGFGDGFGGFGGGTPPDGGFDGKRPGRGER